MKKLIVFLLLTTGCVSLEKRQENFRSNMDDALGRSKTDVIMVMGPPSGIYRVDSRTEVLTWARSAQGPITANNFYGTLYIDQNQWYCQIDFTLIDNKVASWRSNGNACY